MQSWHFAASHRYNSDSTILGSMVNFMYTFDYDEKYFFPGRCSRLQYQNAWGRRLRSQYPRLRAVADHNMQPLRNHRSQVMGVRKRGLNAKLLWQFSGKGSLIMWNLATASTTGLISRLTKDIRFYLHFGFRYQRLQYHFLSLAIFLESLTLPLHFGFYTFHTIPAALCRAKYFQISSTHSYVRSSQPA